MKQLILLDAAVPLPEVSDVALIRAVREDVRAELSATEYLP